MHINLGDPGGQQTSYALEVGGKEVMVLGRSSALTLAQKS